jgi:hypothetical protein
MKNICIVILLFLATIPLFSQTNEEISCKVWQPKSYCDFPKIKNNAIMNINGSTLSIISCDSLDRMKNVVAVRITFTSKMQSQLRLNTGFKNIRLMKQNGITAHPFAIMLPNWTDRNYIPYEYFFLRQDSDNYLLTYESNKAYDIVLIFKDAKVGDTIVIDKFMETVIKE